MEGCLEANRGATKTVCAYLLSERPGKYHEMGVEKKGETAEQTLEGQF